MPSFHLPSDHYLVGFGVRAGIGTQRHPAPKPGLPPLSLAGEARFCQHIHPAQEEDRAGLGVPRGILPSCLRHWSSSPRCQPVIIMGLEVGRNDAGKKLLGLDTCLLLPRRPQLGSGW